mgnify:CR=1 FL=1
MTAIPIRRERSLPQENLNNLFEEDKLIKFVNSEIEKMQASLAIGSGAEPTLYEVNQALCSYQSVNLGLIAAYNIAKIEYMKAKEVFDDWYAHKYILMREKLNPRELAAQKWYSQKEIEMAVRVNFPDEYKRYNEDMQEQEHKIAFMRRLLDSWSGYQFILTQLSKNLVSEISGLGVEGALSQAASKLEGGDSSW